MNENIQFQQVRGVGNIVLDLHAQQRVYAFIGENGIGKTKLLESLFLSLLFTHQDIWQNRHLKTALLPFQQLTSHVSWLPQQLLFKTQEAELFISHPNDRAKWATAIPSLNLPIVYIAAQNRGNIVANEASIQKMGNRQERLKQYLNTLFDAFSQEGIIKQLNSQSNIEEWLIQRAQSANPFQAKEDNREIEIQTLLKLLHQMDKHIDADFMQIDGSGRVFIQIKQQKLALSELSSGFTSILKIFQAIIAGYGYFTNEAQLEQVRGFVLIDEIESHLHNEWQVKIIPLLKQLFPNTTFFITTHSSMILTQLQQGEAYRLKRHSDGVVRSLILTHPNKASLIDLLQEAFDVDLNRLKIERSTPYNQAQAKQHLLSLVQREIQALSIGDTVSISTPSIQTVTKQND